MSTRERDGIIIIFLQIERNSRKHDNVSKTYLVYMRTQQNQEHMHQKYRTLSSLLNK